ncbi:MAG TPA: hypothetical protein VHT27_05775 [Solirubrobacteraceae bacterium]|jgi:hypothetical protein|nr:hypothetical protein [Solirubrobacteraceae bacterium]
MAFVGCGATHNRNARTNKQAIVRAAKVCVAEDHEMLAVYDRNFLRHTAPLNFKRSHPAFYVRSFEAAGREGAAVVAKAISALDSIAVHEPRVQSVVTVLAKRRAALIEYQREARQSHVLRSGDRRGWASLFVERAAGGCLKRGPKPARHG